ncbi:MAG: DUF4190 domain-containing protein [Mycobacterium sp.]
MTEPPESSRNPEPYPGQPPAGPPPGYQPQYPPPYPPPQYGNYQGGYPPAPPQPYGGFNGGFDGGFGAPPVQPKNGLGIAALIVGILSLPAVFAVLGGFVLGLVAIVLGVIGYLRAKKGQATNGGVAIGGIVLGLLGILLNAAVVAFGIWGFTQIGGGDYFDCMQQAGDDTSAQLECEDEFRGNIENRFSVTLTPTP